MAFAGRGPVKRLAPLALAVAVLLLLVWPAAAQIIESWRTDPAFSLRVSPRMWLHTAAIALVATGVAVALGSIMSTWAMHARSQAGRAIIAAIGAFPLVIPMYLHGMAAWQVSVEMGLYAEAAGTGPWTDLLVVGFVEGLRLAAVVHLLLLAGWQSLDGRWLEAGLMCGSPAWVRRRLLVPLLMPFAALGALIAAVMSVTDVGVPLLFQVRSVVALHLWNAHYTALDPVGAWRAMLLPTLILIVVIALLVPPLWRRAAPLLNARRNPTGVSLFPRAPLAALGIVALLLMNGPMLHLMRQVVSLTELLATLRANTALMGASAETAIGAAAVALLIGGCLALTLRRAGPLPLTLTALLFAVPGFLWAAAAIAWWNAPGWRGALLDEGIVRWLVLGGRLIVIPAVLLALARARQSPRQHEAAALAGLGGWLTLRRVTWPPLRRAAWASYALVVLLVVGDLDAAILMDLPGRTTLVVGLCNRLHISPRSPEVAMMAVVILATVAALLIAPILLSKMWRTVRRVA